MRITVSMCLPPVWRRLGEDYGQYVSASNVEEVGVKEHYR